MKKVALFGDSILFGIIIQNGKYAKNKDFDLRKVASEYDLDLLNISQMGRNSGEGVQKVKDFLALHPAPDYAVIEFGGNDADYDWATITKSPTPSYPKIPTQKFVENLTEMAEILENVGTKVSFMSLYPVIDKPYFDWVTPTSEAKNNALSALCGTTKTLLKTHETYNDSVKNLAKTLQKSLIDISTPILEKPDISPYLCIDGVHPSPLGHEIIVQEMRKYFEKIKK